MDPKRQEMLNSHAFATACYEYYRRFLDARDCKMVRIADGDVEVVVRAYR